MSVYALLYFHSDSHVDSVQVYNNIVETGTIGQLTSWKYLLIIGLLHCSLQKSDILAQLTISSSSDK